jgi:hypothetical protein
MVEVQLLSRVIGIQYFTNEERYDGSWVFGVKAGEGVWYYADGSMYEGEWKENKKNGYG